MRLFASFALALSLVITFVSPSLGDAHLGRRHHVHRQSDLAHRDPGEISLHKRFDNARFTYFQVGLGACGFTSQSSDFVRAVWGLMSLLTFICTQVVALDADVNFFHSV